MSSPAATVVYTHGGGRLGNQVIRLAHWLAWTRAHPGAVNVVDLGFWRYAKYFSHWCEQPGCAFPRPSPAANFLSDLQGLLPERIVGRAEWRLQRLVHAAGRHWPGGGAVVLDDAGGEGLDLDDPAVLAHLTRRRVTTCGGWKIASWRLFAEQQAELRGYFRPKPRWMKVAEKFITGLRQRHDLVVGVQIRQSDYRTWNQGRFYFPTSRYVAWIRQLLALHAGRRVAVVVASEEAQDPALFAGLPVHFATGAVNAGGHWFESWVELSLCDLVLGPPSTFSATAAWLGAVPLWPVWAAGQELAPDQLLRDALVDAARHPGFSQCVQ
ncbi:MAG TPA: hypothetical protein VG734_18705 [Lacunisphaera sp.]|nr:hypothetical protein [Lacunisphaera sp.]